MPSQNIDSIKGIFQSRLTTLEHLLKSAQSHFSGSESFLQKRIIADMLPLVHRLLLPAINHATWLCGATANQWII